MNITTVVTEGLAVVGAAISPTLTRSPSSSRSKREEETRQQRRAIRERRENDRAYWDRWHARHPEMSPRLPYARRPLRLLSIDGGGVRGIMSLIILDDLMSRVAPNVRPADYFDLIGGTSTGGLIAIMLGRLRMTIPECIATYSELAQKVFDISFIEKIANLLDAYRFPSKNLEEAVQSVVNKHRQDSSTKMLDTRDNRCRTFVVAIPGCNVDEPVKRFRTYNNRYQRISADRCEIWEAARATSCAPSFFPDVQVDGVYYSDGGLGNNNPGRLVLEEARSLWGPTHPIGCLLSLGTGAVGGESYIRRFKDITDLLSIFSMLERMATSCNTVHQELLHDQGVKPFYYRFNPRMEKSIGLDEWERLGDLQAIAGSYLSNAGRKVDAFVRAMRSGRD